MIYSKKNMKNNFILLLVMFFIFIATWSNIYVHVIINKYLMIINILLFFMNIIINSMHKKKFKRIEFISIISMLFISLLNVLINGSNLGSYIILINFIFIIFMSPYLSIEESKIIFLSKMFLGFFLYWLIANHNGFNTNTIGAIGLYTYIASMFYLDNTNKPKIIRIFITVLTFNFIIQSESRGALIGLIVYIVLKYFIPTKMWSNYISYNFICIILTIGSIIFVLFYVYLWKNNINIQLDFSTKSFYSGRNLIWYELWQVFKENYIIGIGSSYQMKSYTNLNIHNSMYNILVVYGIPVFIVVVSLLLKRLNQVRALISIDKYVLNSICGVFSILTHCFFETNILLTNYSLIILFLFCVMFSRKNKI